MTMTISGDGNITGLVAGGLPDATVTAADLSGAQTGSAPIYGCRAWVNFAGATGAINASGNVTSVTRNSAGNYTVNFTTAMPDANYAAVVTRQLSNYTNAQTVAVETLSASSVVVRSQEYSAGPQDGGTLHLAIFR